MKLLFIGDISTRSGRQVIRDVLPKIKESEKINFVIANAENAAGGRGVTREMLMELQEYGVNFFTSGEHIWDRREFHSDLNDKSLSIVRPYNYEGLKEIPGKGWSVVNVEEQGRIVVMSMLGETFMRDSVRNPFWAFDSAYNEIKAELGEGSLENIPLIVDFHAEATAEKISFAWYVRNRAAAVLGTHTHVATADPRILKANKDQKLGCAFISDVGMCGPYDASLWVDFNTVIHNFKYPFKKAFRPERKGQRIFNSVLVEIEKNKAKNIKRIDKIVD